VATLTPVDDDVWTTTRPLRFWGVETGARMTVVRLGSGAVFVHSPLPLTDGLKAEVDALGPVQAIVAPSLFHHLSANEWKEAYPGAVLACCPGLEKKRSDVPWDRILTDEPEPEWAGSLEQVFFAARTMENEVVFFHPPTRTMICADAIFNLSTHAHRVTRMVALLLGNRRPGATWIERIMIRDRAGAREQIDRMLAWRPRRILLAHGQPIDEDGEAVLRRAYTWL
jgi:hypothetical protein